MAAVVFHPSRSGVSPNSAIVPLSPSWLREAPYPDDAGRVGSKLLTHHTSQVKQIAESVAGVHDNEIFRIRRGRQ